MNNQTSSGLPQGEGDSNAQTAQPGKLLVEVFATDNREDIVAVQELLDHACVEHFVRQRAAGPFPVQVGLASETRVVVSAEHVAVAHSLLREAMDDGAISPSGALLS